MKQHWGERCGRQLRFAAIAVGISAAVFMCDPRSFQDKPADNFLSPVVSAFAAVNYLPLHATSAIIRAISVIFYVPAAVLLLPIVALLFVSIAVTLDFAYWLVIAIVVIPILDLMADRLPTYGCSHSLGFRAARWSGSALIAGTKAWWRSEGLEFGRAMECAKVLVFAAAIVAVAYRLPFSILAKHPATEPIPMLAPVHNPIPPENVAKAAMMPFVLIGAILALSMFRKDKGKRTLAWAGAVGAAMFSFAAEFYIVPQGIEYGLYVRNVSLLFPIVAIVLSPIGYGAGQQLWPRIQRFLTTPAQRA